MSSPPGQRHFDYVLVGGGLSHALLLLALRQAKPGVRVALVESAPRLGGNHTWCFHVSSLGLEARAFTAPLVEHDWPGYSVHFPGLERRLPSRYAMISSARLDSVVRADFARQPGSALFLGVSAERILPGSVGSGRADSGRAHAAGAHAGTVELSSGQALTGDVVSDARGPERYPRAHAMAFQKFLGLELSLSAPPPEREPRLMDARVPQHEGFRFVYTLPLSERRALIEDTYYSRSPELDRGQLQGRILRYAAENGYRVQSVLREEHGVLPIPLRYAGLSRATPRPAPGPLSLGYAGGWFHPTTGYSLPIAARLAHAVATHAAGAELERALASLAESHARQARFCVLLNRMLFGGFAPAAQRNVLERFYRLPEASIERFYALALSRSDPLRILCGRPPEGLSIKRLLYGQAMA